MGSNPKPLTNQQTSSASTSIGGPRNLLVVLRVSQSLISVGFDSADFALLIACNLTARSQHAAEPAKRIQKTYDASGRTIKDSAYVLIPMEEEFDSHNLVIDNHKLVVPDATNLQTKHSIHNQYVKYSKKNTYLMAYRQPQVDRAALLLDSQSELHVQEESNLQTNNSQTNKQASMRSKIHT